MQEPIDYAAGARAYAERGVAGLAETWHPDVVYEEDPRWPGAATFRGREAVIARFREYEDELGAGAARTERVVEGSNGVVLIWTHSGVTPGAGVPFEHRWAWLIQEKDGLAVHIRAYFEPDEALAAAGA